MRSSCVALSKRTRIGGSTGRGGEKARSAAEAAERAANPPPPHRMRHATTRSPLVGLTKALELPKRAEPPSPPEPVPEAPVEKKLELFTCDRQLAARMMPVSAVMQTVLAVLHTSSLMTVKKGLAEADRLEQIRLGVENAVVQPWSNYLQWYDWALSGVVWGAPLLLLVSTRFTSQRWIASLALLPGSQCEVVTYNWIGNLHKRVVPLSAVQRTRAGRHLLIDGRHFLLYEKTGKYPNRSVFERVIKVKQ